MGDFHLSLGLDKAPRRLQTVCVRVGDRGSCRIRADLFKAGLPADLEGCSARFEMLKADGAYVRDAACKVSGSTVEHVLCAEAASAPGVARVAYFAILEGGDVVDSTESFEVRVLDSMESAGPGMPESYLSEVDAMLAELEEAKAKALSASALAHQAAGRADDAAEDVLRRAEEGEFDGPKGPQGPQGEPGVAVSLDHGYFGMTVEDGHLIVTHNDNEPAPPLSIRDGHLIYTID